jgi:hypothetical protein
VIQQHAAATGSRWKDADEQAARYDTILILVACQILTLECCFVGRCCSVQYEPVSDGANERRIVCCSCFSSIFLKKNAIAERTNERTRTIHHSLHAIAWGGGVRRVRCTTAPPRNRCDDDSSDIDQSISRRWINVVSELDAT